MRENRSFWSNEIVKDIIRIIAIQSDLYSYHGIERCQKAIKNIAEKMGFNTSKHGNESVLVIEPKGFKAPAKLGVLVHLDTVPFKKKDWSFNPLGEVANDRIYGRGVIDDKAGIILALYTFKYLEDKIQPSWQIIVGSAEESDWSDMKDFLREKPVLPEFLITIDGDGVQNGCRGYMDLELKFKKQKKTKFITKLYVPDGVSNVIPNCAIAKVNGDKLTAGGIAKHSSEPAEGTKALEENALLKLTNQISKNKFYRDEFKNFFDFLEMFQKENCAELLGFAPGSSASPTMCKLDDKVITLCVNVRLGMETKEEDLLNNVLMISQKYDCPVAIETLIYPACVSADSREIRMLCDVYEKVMGRRPSPSIAQGVGYNAALPNSVIFGPRFEAEDDEADLCHAVDESRNIQDLKDFMNMLQLFALEYLKDSEK